MAVRVRWDLPGLENLSRFFGVMPDREYKRLLRQLGAIYLGFIRRRYAKYSRGGGNWAPLADSTIRSRRKGGRRGQARSKVNARKTGGPAAILRDTGLLFNALKVSGIKPSRGGQLRMKGRSVRAGFDENIRHPDTEFSYAELADIHQNGTNAIPARPIFVEPDEKTKRIMRRTIKAAIKRIGGRHGRR